MAQKEPQLLCSWHRLLAARKHINHLVHKSSLYTAVELSADTHHPAARTSMPEPAFSLVPSANSQQCRVCPLPVQVQPPQQQQVPSVSPTAFDAVLLSIIHITDELSLAADSLLDLTAAMDPTAGNSSMELASTSNSSSTGAAALSGSLHLTPILHQASTAPAALDPSPGHQQQGEDASTAHRMSRQALAMATEALKLATLLEGQQDGCDPANQELLQQIAAAARLVSVMAADIVQPAGQDAGVPADSSNITFSSAAVPAPALTAEASTEPGAPAGGSSSSGSVVGTGSNGLHSFAGLPVLGVRMQDPACRVAELQDDILQQCLQL